MLHINTSFRTRLLLATVPVVLVAACGGSPNGTSPSADATSTTNATGVTPANTSATTTDTTASTSAQPTLSSATLALSRPRPPLAITAPLVGVTVDDTSNISAIVASLKSINKVPTTRIVFDEFVAASDYRDATTKIRNVSYVMGELLDSFSVSQYSVQQYLDRTREYLGALGDVVDIWEVGNEINGEWLGNNSDVVAKMTGAYDLVKAQGKTTELTLYYNQDCWDRPSNEMFTWANNNVPTRMKQGLDYVLISYYEDDCNGLQPDWPNVFAKLHAMFPKSKIGFGETGTVNAANKAEFVRRYYTKSINVPNYVGGYFWWYFKQDMVPNTKGLLTTLNDAVGTATPVPAPTPTPSPTSPVVTPSTPLTAAYWTTVYDGYGSVTYDAAKGIVMAPQTSTTYDETHAALVLGKNATAKNFRLSVTGITEQQLRQNSSPNAWETLWIFFNYNPKGDGKDTNYFALKPNGVELGTAYQDLGQTFLYTGPTNATAVGVSNKFDIEKIGNHVTVSINGHVVTDFTGALVDVPGSIGLYSEDARVRITNVQFTPLP